MSVETGKSISTLQRHFDAFEVDVVMPLAPRHAINLLLDATFFARTDGVLVFRSNQVNLYWRFVVSETLAEISAGLDALEAQGYQFQSAIIDGRQGVIQLFLKRYSGIPIQLCQFHQTQTIRRYTTNNPKTDCGRDLKALMQQLTLVDEITFRTAFEHWCQTYEHFLNERNEQNEFKHKPLRSARRSIKKNLPYLFTYLRFPELHIPNTTNSCDGSFAHWKQKVKIHRGTKKHRRNKLISYLLSKH